VTAKNRITVAPITGARTDRQNIIENVGLFAREPLFQNGQDRIAQSRMSRFTKALQDLTGIVE
jgi:hypothetical protein